MGYLVVFFEFVLLMVVVMLLGRVMRVQTAPAAQSTPAASEVVKCPMPGNILKINVSPGQHVKKGDVLIVLEAMKMENKIVASKGGTVAQIALSKA